MFEKFIPIDVINLDDIRSFKKVKDEVISYYYKYYSHFQNERSKLLDLIKINLNQHCINFSFKDWQMIAMLM